MAFSIDSYVDPGTYQQEVLVPGAGAITSIPFTACYIGVANRNKRVLNEAVMRGQISAEDVVFAGTPKVDYLASLALRRYSLVSVTQDGTALVGGTDWTFVAPFVSSTYTTGDLATLNAITLSLDGKLPITAKLSNNVAGSGYTVSLVAGHTNRFSVVINGTANMTAITGVQLAGAINAMLNFADATALSTTAALAYGPTYNSAAAYASTTLTITSVEQTGSEDVVILDGPLSTEDMVFAGVPKLVFTSTVLADSYGALHARTQLKLNSTYLATAAYKATYVATNSSTDALVNATIQRFIRVGSYAGVTSFTSGVDYTNGSTNIAWSGAWTSAVVTGVAGMEVGATFNVSVNNTLQVAVDGKAAIAVTLSGMANPPVGGPNPATPALATATEIAAIINGTLAASQTYGPKYNGVATVSSGKIVLTSPTGGAAGQVELTAPTSLSAVLTVFGLTSTQLPYTVRGVGTAPAAASLYYATYEYTRPLTDYNTPKQYFSVDAARTDLGYETATNQLMLAASLAFKNGAPSIFTIQVNDATATGSATLTEMETALSHAGDKSAITEVVCLDTRTQIAVDVVSHVTAQCGPVIQQPRRGWFGMARGTAVGDKDTAGTLRYMAAHTLQVPADSPARGRSFLMGPTTASVTVTLEDGTSTRVLLDGSYIAAAAAAMFTARPSVAASMMTVAMTGFNIDDFGTYLPVERRLLADGGVCVVTNDGGRLVLLDPISTERAGGRLPQFEEPSSSSQKDNISANVTAQLNSGARGIVPSDLSDFIFTLKAIIGGVLEQAVASGSIGPFRDATGRTRAINYATDIQVFQSKSDPRKYTFRYFFMLRYPAKWFFGEWSVDNPFFSSKSSSLIA
jgi:hypothetical protein